MPLILDQVLDRRKGCKRWALRLLLPFVLPFKTKNRPLPPPRSLAGMLQTGGMISGPERRGWPRAANSENGRGAGGGAKTRGGGHGAYW